MTIKRTIIRLTTLLLSALFIVLTAAPVSAQTPEQITSQSLYGNWEQYVPGDGPLGAACGAAALPGGGTSVGQIPLRGGSPVEQAYNYFIDRGLTPAQSAGIVGNLIVESGVDPRINQVGGGPGRGIAQWSAGDRWDTTRPHNGQPANVLAFAKTRTPPDPFALVVQLDFIWHEMNNIPPWNQTLPAIKQAASPSDAAIVFMQKYEKPAGFQNPNSPTAIKRKEAAERVFADPVNAGKGGGTSMPTSGQLNCGSNGGIGVGGRLVFPLVTSKSTIRNHKPYSWCFDSQTNCHHDYNAADIMISEGTQVIAAAPGKVVLARSTPRHAASVAILGDDKHVYFYQHLAPGSLSVANQQQVAAQAPLGKVGDRRAAFNTPPHLHFDMQPPPATNRPGCSGAACRSVNFLNVQPPLIEAFNTLPE
jgi:murein DD-endopeptidase MepM/ murein hydrolase activator NlpD